MALIPTHPLPLLARCSHCNLCVMYGALALTAPTTPWLRPPTAHGVPGERTQLRVASPWGVHLRHYAPQVFSLVAMRTGGYPIFFLALGS